MPADPYPFLLSLLFESGPRIGEALGMRHEDLSIAKGQIRIEPRENDNGARVKHWKPRTVPVNSELFTIYAGYMDLEYGAIDSDHVFVNLVRGQRGLPLTYSTVRDLVLRLRHRHRRAYPAPAASHVRYRPDPARYRLACIAIAAWPL